MYSGAILIVEDKPDLRAMAQRVLKRQGYRTYEAGCGPDALALLERHGDIQLLFTDVILGGAMNGVELARLAGSRYPGIKVLMTSGYAGDALEREGVDEEDAGLLKKPYRLTELLGRVAALMGGL